LDHFLVAVVVEQMPAVAASAVLVVEVITAPAKTFKGQQTMG
jgi:hypothetical protein